jgi:hypothetical protein
VRVPVWDGGDPECHAVGRGSATRAAGPFAQDGLWGIAFGNDGMAVLQPGQPAVDLHQPHNTLFLTAGPNKAANGLYGRIDLPPK